MKFTERERDVLRWIVRTWDDEALVQQLMDAKPCGRKFIGVGSFTLCVPASAAGELRRCELVQQRLTAREAMGVLAEDVP